MRFFRYLGSNKGVMTFMVHEVQMGKLRKRMSFSRIDEVLDMPNLIEVQKNSYKRFLTEDLKEVLADVSPITDYSENLVLEFVDYSLDGTPKNSVERCKERDLTYAAPLKVFVRLKNRETGEIKESEVFMGDFPLMTEHGTFIINGAERVIVSQLVRSPGAYFGDTIDKSGKHLFSSQIIPNRGAWLEYETDNNDVLWVRIDRARKLPITVLLRALGYGTDQEIYDLLGEDERLTATIARSDQTKTQTQGLLEIYKRQKPGEPPTEDGARALLRSLFFDPKRYDLMRVGRYKFNKKLGLYARIANQVAAEDIINPVSGEVMVEKGNVIDRETAIAIQNSGVNAVPKGQREAALSLGMRESSVFLKVIFPQAIRYVIPALIAELVIVVKDTTFAYVVNFPDLMQNAKVLISNYDAMLSVYLVVAIIYILINYLLNLASRRAARRMNRSFASSDQSMTRNPL